MKNKKFFLIFLILLTLTSSVLFTGYTMRETSVSLSFSLDGKPVFDKTYPLSFSSSLSLFLFYGNDIQKLYNKRFLGNPTSLYDYLNPNITPEVKSILSELDSPPKQAEALFDKNGKFTYTEGKNGLKVNIRKTLERSVYTNKADKTEISYDILLPSVTVSELKRKTVKIATFSTNYGKSSYGRKKNISLAVSRLDGLKIEPGEEFSFNKAVGKRTTENGFSDAVVIKNGEYTVGVGGGVCQVSTTLYNAWLYTGQAVVASRSHSLVPSYVKPGLDAMVSDSGDLVLRNNSLSPIYVDSHCDGNVLTFTLYGEKPEREIELYSELIKTTPYAVYDYVYGEEEMILSEPKPGKTYRSYRIYKDENGLTEKEFLRISDYLPQKGKKSLKTEDKSDKETTN